MSEKKPITEFLLVAGQGNVDGLKSCLVKNVDVNTINHQGRTAIIIASLNRHYDCVSLLIAAGADINKQDQTCLNLLLINCLTNDLVLLRMALSANPNLNCLSRLDGIDVTPANEKGHVEIIHELLLRTDINVDRINFVGWTPFLEAVMLNNGGVKQQEIVKLLFDHGVNPRMTDRCDKTPLELAREKGYYGIAELLIAVKA